MHRLPSELAFTIWQHGTDWLHLQRRLQRTARRPMRQHKATTAGGAGAASRDLTKICAVVFSF
jgi:hypothetical protein